VDEATQRRLWKASESGDLKEVKQCLESGTVNVNQGDPSDVREMFVPFVFSSLCHYI